MLVPQCCIFLFKCRIIILTILQQQIQEIIPPSAAKVQLMGIWNKGALNLPESNLQKNGLQLMPVGPEPEQS